MKIFVRSRDQSNSIYKKRWMQQALKKANFVRNFKIAEIKLFDTARTTCMMLTLKYFCF